LEAVLARRESYARRANCDPLTNLLNRTAFEREVRRELRRAERYPAISSFAFMDIDNFKEVNDSYGHAAGDRVLVTLASVMNAAFRSVDIIGRFGGEEFVVYLPETPEPRALIVLQRLQELFAEAQEGAGHPVRGFSAGVVEIPRDGADLEGLRDRADAAMYAAKRQGKGRVVPWRPGLEAQNEESPANSG
jgi:diguanylate cyclase (GGDEF)-like protein